MPIFSDTASPEQIVTQQLDNIVQRSVLMAAGCYAQLDAIINKNQSLTADEVYAVFDATTRTGVGSGDVYNLLQLLKGLVNTVVPDRIADSTPVIAIPVQAKPVKVGALAPAVAK